MAERGGFECLPMRLSRASRTENGRSCWGLARVNTKEIYRQKCGLLRVMATYAKLHLVYAHVKLTWDSQKYIFL